MLEAFTIIFVICWMVYLTYNSIYYLIEFFKTAHKLIVELMLWTVTVEEEYIIELPNGEVHSFSNYESAAEVFSVETGEQI